MTVSKKNAVVSGSFLSYWRILEATIPVKVELVLEAGLASGLPRAADRHDLSQGQASSLGRRDDPQGESLPTPQPSRHPTARGAHTATQRPDSSWPQTLYYADADT